MNKFVYNVGKVNNFDGVSGNIITDKDTYLFSYDGAYSEVKDGDIVTFNIRDYEDKIVSDVQLYEEKKDFNAILDSINGKFTGDLNQYVKKNIDEDTYYKKGR